MEIIPMNAVYAPEVAALEKACFRDPWSEASIRGELENPLSLWLVAVEQGAVVGYIGSQTVLDTAPRCWQSASAGAGDAPAG